MTLYPFLFPQISQSHFYTAAKVCGAFCLTLIMISLLWGFIYMLVIFCKSIWTLPVFKPPPPEPEDKTEELREQWDIKVEEPKEEKEEEKKEKLREEDQEEEKSHEGEESEKD